MTRRGERPEIEERSGAASITKWLACKVMEKDSDLLERIVKEKIVSWVMEETWSYPHVVGMIHLYISHSIFHLVEVETNV
jgi:hypothetical protein